MRLPAFFIFISLAFSIALAAPPPEAFSQSPLAQNPPVLPAPVAPVEGTWEPGRQITISNGCLMRWICDCSKVKAPRRARIERTPSESTAGICRAGPDPSAGPDLGAAPARSAGPGGACAVCGASPPKEKCMCAVKLR